MTEVFGGADTPWWSAGHHSPDIMLAAATPDAVNRGEFLLVLGELHLAFNALESRLFVEQHEEPARLHEALARHGGERVYAVLPKSSPFVTSRLAPPSAMLTAENTFWSWAAGTDSVAPPGPIMPAADLLVWRDHDRLVVRSGSTDDEFDFIETIGEILSGAVVNAFQPFASTAHRPRVTIDRLVVSRESWAFDAARITWAFAKDERDRFTGARAWRRDHEMPERAFVKVPVEDKPTFVDFTSPVLVDMLAKSVRRTADAGGPGSVNLSEVLPDLDQLWLADASGGQFTSELRFMVTYT
ncbi:MAG TPA: lantibiotic dehydratase [Umezawaea sp.]|nr:lantibiotic dehydratase [Umezawaea sp.]